MKVCKVCNLEKPIEEFVPHWRLGTTNVCRHCHGQKIADSRKGRYPQKSTPRHLLSFEEWIKSHPSSSGYVYILQGIYGGPVKIGFATYLKNRIAECNTYSPFPLQAIAITYGSSRLELELHHRFRHLHIHREWYRPAHDIAQMISSEGWEVVNQINPELNIIFPEKVGENTANG